MACKLYSGTDNVIFDIHRVVPSDTDNNTINSVGEDGSVKALEYGYAAEYIEIKFENMTAAKRTELKTFLYDYRAEAFNYKEIDGVSDAVSVRWWDKRFRCARHHHNSHYGRIKLRVEKT